MDLFLAILIGIGALIVYYTLVSLMIALIPVFVGLGIFLTITLVAYLILKSRRD